MTAKRFNGHDIYNGVNEHFQFYDNNKRISNKEVLEFLNKFSDENEQLKSLIKALKKSNIDYINQIRKAYEENLSIEELADNCGVDLK